MEMVSELVASLEQATLMSKQLPHTTDPSKLTQIYATLHSAHFHLSSFLHHSFRPPPPPQPSLPPPPPAENSLSSAAAANDNDDDPMEAADEDEDEQEESNSKPTIDGVEERLKDFFIQNKRPKRPLSPAIAVAAEEDRQRGRSDENDFVRGSVGFDPLGTRRRALDLIYQFHG